MEIMEICNNIYINKLLPVNHKKNLEKLCC